MAAVNPAQGVAVNVLHAASAEQIALQPQAEEQVLDEVSIKNLAEVDAQGLEIIFEMNKAAARSPPAAKQQRVGGECRCTVATRHEFIAQDGIIPAQQRTVVVHEVSVRIKSG